MLFLATTSYGTGVFEKKTPIKIGILHSLTGTMAISEQAVVDATLMAIESINQQGGLLGRRLQPVVADGKSDWPTFAKEAERLIKEEKVSVVFGCWTSASRRTVKPIFEAHNHLLFYPVQYEGVEQSPNIVYTGAAPNQQIIPGVFWASENLGKKFFLVGSDYIFPRIANEIIRDQVASLGGQIVGEVYIPLGGKEVEEAVNKILESKPEVILNTINGDTNVAFFSALRAKGITPSQVPTLSFSIAEQELSSLNFQDMIGDYAVWNYFQSLNSIKNAEFLVDFASQYPGQKAISDPMEAAYLGVNLWASAVTRAQSDQPGKVREVLGDQKFHGPEGLIYLDADNHHTWKFVRIGKIRFDGQFSIVWNSGKQIHPEPYPPFKSVEEWEALLDKFYQGWGQKWGK